MPEPIHPTITGDQRRAVHEWLIWHLHATFDAFADDVTKRGDSSHTREYLETIEDGLALLNDLGWPKDDPRETFEVTVPEDRLDRLLTHIREDASLTLFGLPPLWWTRGVSCLALCDLAVG